MPTPPSARQPDALEALSGLQPPPTASDPVAQAEQVGSEQSQDQDGAASPAPVETPKAESKKVAPKEKVKYEITPYVGPYKECDSITLTPEGISKPVHCCWNANKGLLKYGAVYTVTAPDGSTKDCCAQCANVYETGTEA